MKKNFLRKLTMVALASSMIISCVAGCGVKDADSENQSNTAVTSDSAKDNMKKIELPIKDDVTLSCFISTRPNTDDYTNNKMTEQITKDTGIKLSFVVANESDATTKLNTLLSTGDYPDIIFGPQLTLDVQSMYGSNGSLISLNKYIDTVGENTKETFEQVPEARALYTMNDGNIYNLPVVKGSFNMQTTQMMWIYKPWMEKLNLQMPKTTDDFEKVLKAFKENDPNGNGIADEIPLAGCRKGGWESEVESFLMNAFVYTSYNQNGRWLYLDNGKVTPAYMQDAWKDGLKYLNKLTSEGLLDAESFTMDNDGLKRLGENPDTVILGCFPGGWAQNATAASGDRWKDYVAVEPLTGPKGVSYCKYEPQYQVGAAGSSITDHCEHPDEAFALLDYMYGKDIGMWNSEGVQGVNWDYLPSDTTEIGINGKQAKWKRISAYTSGPSNQSWNAVGNRHIDSEFFASSASDGVTIEKILYDATKDEYLPHVPDKSVPMPKIVMTQDESNEALTYSTTINNYTEEYLTDCILGNKDVDNTWNDYINELKSQGVEKFISIYQEAYEAKYKK